jgi:hypothetical protein
VLDQLVVITGAGASHDATQRRPHRAEFRPPLVSGLFSEHDEFTSILGHYPDAQTLAGDLIYALNIDTRGLEAYLHDNILNSEHAYDRRRYRTIPLYLQHLLTECSRNFTPHPINYDRLINAALRKAEHVLFLTLNYDALLDSRLHHHTPIARMSDYIREDLPWALVKLHGSVDWMRQILNDPPQADGYAAYVSALGEELRVGDPIVLRARSPAETPPVEDMRVGGGQYFYPALSVPLGPDDELNCPPEHRDFASQRLEQADGLHIISVGYSGLDSGLLNLLAESKNELRSLLAINPDATAAREAANRIAGAFKREAHDGMMYAGTFDNFVWTSALEAHLNTIETLK